MEDAGLCRSTQHAALGKDGEIAPKKAFAPKLVADSGDLEVASITPLPFGKSEFR
jgi:hypothetical protein